MPGYVRDHSIVDLNDIVGFAIGQQEDSQEPLNAYCLVDDVRRESLWSESFGDHFSRSVRGVTCEASIVKQRVLGPPLSVHQSCPLYGWLNFLPQPISMSLKGQQKCIPDRFANVL